MKWFWRILGIALLAVVVIDAVRYLRPEPAQQLSLQPPGQPGEVREVIFVYNALGGLLPGLADLLHKEMAPSSYPCNLCYQTFGTFSMKEEWKRYLQSLPMKQSFLHKDTYLRTYADELLPLPAVLAGDGQRTWVLIDAERLNSVRSLEELIRLMNERLGR